MSDPMAASMKDVQLVRLRLSATPTSPNAARDGWGFRVDAYETIFTDAEQPVTLDIEVADSTRTSLSVNDSAFRLLVAEALQTLVASRLDRHGAPAIEQIRSW